MKSLNTLLFMLACIYGYAQSSSIKGQLQDADGAPVEYANVALYQSVDSSLHKVEKWIVYP